MILWKLYKREVWFDEKTANAICTPLSMKHWGIISFVCFFCWINVLKSYPKYYDYVFVSLRIMTVALSSLLENKKSMIKNDKDHDDSDGNGNSPLNHLIDKQVCDRYRSFILVLDFGFGSSTFNPIWYAGFWPNIPF